MNAKLLVGAIITVGVIGLMAALADNKSVEDNAGNVTTTENGDLANNAVSANKTDSTTNSPIAIPAVPFYPEAKTVNTQDNASAAEKNITLSLETADSVALVNDWYRTALNSDGWSLVGDKTVGGYVLLEGEKDKLKVFVQAANFSEGVIIITERIKIRQ